LHTTTQHSCTSGTFSITISPFHDLHPSLHDTLVVVMVTVATGITTAAVTAMREVALPRQGDAMQWQCVMATKWGDVRSKVLAQAQLLNSLPALRLCCGVNGGVSHAGLMVLEKLKEKGETPTQI
jgi:hypothetical protein